MAFNVISDVWKSFVHQIVDKNSTKKIIVLHEKNAVFIESPTSLLEKINDSVDQLLA